MSRVHLFRLDGTFVRQFSTGSMPFGKFCRPFGVAVRGNEVFLVDANESCVRVFRFDGMLVRVWNIEGPDLGQTKHLSALGVTRQGQILVCNTCNTPHGTLQVFE